MIRKENLITEILPVGKLDKPTSFTNWYFNRDYLTILQERLSQIFISDIRIQPSNKYLKGKLRLTQEYEVQSLAMQTK